MLRQCTRGRRFDFVEMKCVSAVDMVVNCHPKCPGQFLTNLLRTNVCVFKTYSIINRKILNM